MNLPVPHDPAWAVEGLFDCFFVYLLFVEVFVLALTLKSCGF